MPPMLPKQTAEEPAPAVRLALGGGMPMTGEALTKPDIRLALATNQSTSGGRDHNDSGFGKPDIRLATTIHSGAMSPEQFERALNARPTPDIRLAHSPGAQGDNVLIGQRGVKPMADDSLPALLVSYFYLDQFLKNRHRYHYRDWVMDSGAFSAHNSGAEISLQAYIDQCKQLMASDPTLSEIYALDVIGDWKASHKNTQIMWDQGVPAIPCFHVGEPWEVLMGLAKDYPKIALGGVAQIGSKKALAWASQCFARIWPKKVHGFAMCSEVAVMTLPFHCMTDEHQILTNKGWKGRETIKTGDQVLGFKDGESQWEEVLEVMDYQVENELINHIDNRTISARVTANHRWRVLDSKTGQWKWTTTNRLHLNDRIPRCANYTAPTEKVYEDWFVSLFAWYWTEGHIKARPDCKKPSITIVQSLTANPMKVELIRGAMKQSGEKHCEYVTHRTRPELIQVEDDMVTWELYGHVRDRLLALSPDKDIPIEFLISLTKEQLQLFIQISVQADGFATDKWRINKTDGFGLWQKGGKNIEQFRIACLLAGHATSYYESGDGAAAQTVSNTFITPKRYGKKPSVRNEQVLYSGHLWCVRVASGAFFTKCNQHIYVTGNSVDSTSWEIGPCKFGNWRAFGGQRVSVRGSKQNLRAEVEWYLELERKARVKWKKQMAELEAVAPTVRLAVCFDKSHDMLARTHPVETGPDVRLVAANDGGQGGGGGVVRLLGEPADDLGQLKQAERERERAQPLDWPVSSAKETTTH